MYVSMTGFCRITKEASWGSTTLELSSVNHRYQEISVRLPREFQGMEPWFHQKLRKAFRRGKLQARVEVVWASSLRTATLNADALVKYYNDLFGIIQGLDILHEVQLESLLSLPGVLETNGPHLDDEDQLAFFDRLVDESVASWLEMRNTEGAHLSEAILQGLSELESLAGKIFDMWEPAKNAAFGNLKKRLEKSLEAIGMTEKIEDVRFIQEAVILSDRWDVSEELARLASHIVKFRETGASNETSGRKLDFLIQEMNREVNTLDSKVTDAPIRWLAVEAKAALEKMREQIQNLE